MQSSWNHTQPLPEPPRELTAKEAERRDVESHLLARLGLWEDQDEYDE